MKKSYLEMIQLIERLHRQFLEVVKAELDRLGIEDINNVQSLILAKIGDEELTVGELTYRGYYLGSNVSYNVKKLVENGYLQQERSAHDHRSVWVKVAEKGKSVCNMVSELYDHHVKALDEAAMSKEEIEEANRTLRGMERFWAHNLAYSPSDQGPSSAVSAA